VADKLVVIYTYGIGNLDSGLGAWAAVLTYGEHVREIDDVEEIRDVDGDTTEDNRMELLAIVRALECLTRAVSVQVWVDSPYIRMGVTAVERKPDPNDDLWLRLAEASKQHQIEWVWIEDDVDNPNYQNASRLATEALEAAELDEDELDEGEDSFEGPSIDSVLKEFLADRQERGSPRTHQKYEGVISSLRWGIDWYADKKLSAIPAGDIIDHLGNFFQTLIHKQFASVSELKEVRTVLPALLNWLRIQGHLDAETTTSEIEEVKGRIDEYIDLRKFVDAISDHVGHQDFEYERGSGDNLVSNQYLWIDEVTDNSITFVDWDEKLVGPITVPPKIADLASPEWQILLSAVCVDGEWRLLQVANGEI
jgi:ribonuclease HI